jgi:predicted GH43/DUF377 family glycosyl hydrolase
MIRKDIKLYSGVADTTICVATAYIDALAESYF